MEEWKNIEGFEGLYQVSTLGRIKSLKFNKEKILKLQSSKKGYKVITLRINNQSKYLLVHRLVAQAFIPNQYNLPQVNHIDEDKSNNCVENLEWCSNEYNHNYGTRNIRATRHHIGKPVTPKKKVFQYDLDGNFIQEFESLSSIKEKLGYCITPISFCCHGGFKDKSKKNGWHTINQAYGFFWKYA